MNILLHPITIDNWRNVIFLDPGIQNSGFIEPNSTTIMEILFRFPNEYLQYLKGIYVDSQLIGFTAFYPTQNTQNIYIHTFMIDQRFQGNGWGKKSFAKVLEHIQETFHPHTIELSTNNPIAIGLYSSFGFVSEDTDRSREYFQKYRETLFILRVCR